jgi:hypothetical protein
MTLHFEQIFFTDARTFIAFVALLRASVDDAVVFLALSLQLSTKLIADG